MTAEPTAQSPLDLVRAAQEWAPRGWKVEFISRVLLMSPRPAELHGVTHDSVAFWLRDFFAERNPRKRGPGGWYFRNEPELHLGEVPDVFNPDVAAWRIERAPSDATENRLVIVPDWVCEVLSPTTEKIDRSIKADAYAKHGVLWYWLIDPAERTVEVYTPRDGAMVLRAKAMKGDRSRLPPFEAEELALDELWFARPAGTESTA